MNQRLCFGVGEGLSGLTPRAAARVLCGYTRCRNPRPAATRSHPQGEPVSDFNLRRLVREVQSASTLTDPHAIADEVLRRIDDRDLRPALRKVLASMVREETRSSLNHSLRSMALPAAPAPEPPAPRLTLHKQDDALQVATAPPPAPARSCPAVPPGYSAKVAGIRAAGPGWLRERLYANDDPRGYKFLGDATFSDLMFAAELRRDQAARTTAMAERYEALAGLLESHGVERVRDLPARVLALVGGAAA